MKPSTGNKIAAIIVLVFELIMIFVSGFISYYDAGASPFFSIASEIGAISSSIDDRYPMFQDVQVMVFVGFGFLMTFLKKYAHTALGLTFLISCVVIQFDILLEGFWEMKNATTHVSLVSLINADVAAAAFLISFGAVLGKINFLQVVVMAFIHTPFYVANKYIVEEVLEAKDVGGSMVVHAFGAYFGVAVCVFLAPRKKAEVQSHKLEESTYESDIFAMIGTLFLWMFWPSFNAAFVSGNEKYRVVLNTYLSLVSSCISAMAFSMLLNKESKLNMVHVQNGTLAGGVAIGALCNLYVRPFGAMCVGTVAGMVTVLGYRYLQNEFVNKLLIHDTCGVQFLHGMPGVLGAFIGAILTMFASKSSYGDRLFEVFPAMSPFHRNRTAAVQGCIQLAALGTTLALALGGGFLAGVIVGFAIPGPPLEGRFNDELLWTLEQANDD